MLQTDRKEKSRDSIGKMLIQLSHSIANSSFLSVFFSDNLPIDFTFFQFLSAGDDRIIPIESPFIYFYRFTLLFPLWKSTFLLISSGKPAPDPETVFKKAKRLSHMRQPLVVHSFRRKKNYSSVFSSFFSSSFGSVFTAFSARASIVFLPTMLSRMKASLSLIRAMKSSFFIPY